MLRNVKNYYRPTTVEEAVALVQSNPNAVYLGCGAWTVAQGDPNLETVVDLQDMGLGGIAATDQAITLGAMVTLQEIIDHPESSTLANGVLATASSFTQSRSLREQGTLGGTLIVAGAADPLTTVLLVLDSEVHYADPTAHKIPFVSFVGYRERLIKTKVLLTQVSVQRLPAQSATSFQTVGRSPKDKPIVCAAAYVAVEEGLPAEVRIAVGGADAQPVRLHKAEHLLKGQLLNAEKIDQVLASAGDQLHPPADFRGSAAYRLEMAQVLSRRAILEAWERARRG